MMLDDSVRLGDLVITDDRYYAIVIGVLNNGQLEVMCSNGLRQYALVETLTFLPIQQDEHDGTAHANFYELLRRQH